MSTSEQINSFNSKLSKIIKILKQSPGNQTIENIQRLCNIYKFETFIETIEDDGSKFGNSSSKRMSIAGKILVIDIDFKELENKFKNQTKFELLQVKCILANNNNNFQITNSVTGENILENCFRKYESLAKFDVNLEKLSILDEFSSVKVDLFDYYMRVFEYVKGAIPSGNVVLNHDDEFKISIEASFEISIVNQELLELRVQNGEVINDIGISVKFLNERFITNEFFLKENGIRFDKGRVHVAEVFANNEILRANGKTIEFFNNFSSELVALEEVYVTNTEDVTRVLDRFRLFSQLMELKSRITSAEGQGQQDTDASLEDFLSEDRDMDVDVEHVNIVLEDECVRVGETSLPYDKALALELESRVS